jgi:AcrR family transcriptional regulator
VAEKITKEKIIASVLKIAFEKGIAGTSLADIAGDLGIKKASLYNHFESRDDILAATGVFCASLLRANPYIPPDYKTTAAKYSVRAVLKGIVRRYLKLYERDLPLRVIMYVESGKYFYTKAAEAAREERAKIRVQVRTLFSAFAAEGKLPFKNALELDTAAWCFTEAVSSYTAECLFEIKWTLAQDPAGKAADALGAKKILEIDGCIDRLCASWKINDQ